MQYKYEKVSSDYSDLASGRVFYSSPGYPAFPVRLASEIFQRCIADWKAIYNITDPCTLYDPCCGAAYHLRVVAYLHREHIREIIASDIDEKGVELAKRNLELLTVAGLDQRISEITKMLEQYHKDSHKDALASTHVLKKKLTTFVPGYPLRKKVFQANVLDSKTILRDIQAGSVDIVFTDVPYGEHSQWKSLASNESLNPLGSMLEMLLDVLSSSSIVEIVSDKKQKVVHEQYQRLEQFQVGKRRVVILKPT